MASRLPWKVTALTGQDFSDSCLPWALCRYLALLDIVCIVTYTGMHCDVVRKDVRITLPGNIFGLWELLPSDIKIPWNFIEMIHTTWQHIDQSQQKKKLTRCVTKGPEGHLEFWTYCHSFSSEFYGSCWALGTPHFDMLWTAPVNRKTNIMAKNHWLDTTYYFIIINHQSSLLWYPFDVLTDL